MINSKFKKSPIYNFSASILLLATLTACGGGGSSNQPPAGTEIDISGFATKGIIGNGLVEITDANNPAQILVSGNTDPNGFYALTIPTSAGFNEGFLLVEIKAAADGSTTMTCDAADDCGDIPFGQPISLTDEFSILAINEFIVDDNAPALSINLNPFTDLAAGLAMANGMVDRTDLANASNLVAQQFDLGATALSNIASLDLNDADAIAAADAATLKAATISGALLASSFELADVNVGTSLTTFRDIFVAAEGQLLINEPDGDNNAVISLRDLLENSITLGEKLATESNIDLSLLADFRADLVQAKSAAKDSFTTIIPSPNTDLNAAQQARAFVADIDLLLVALEQQKLATDKLAFENTLQVSDQLLSDNFELLIEQLVIAISSFNAAYQEQEQNPALDIFQPDSGFLVSIIENADGNSVFSITSETDAMSININAAVDDTTVVQQESEPDGGGPTDPDTIGTLSGSASLVFDGNVSWNNGTESISLTINQGLVAVTDFDSEQLRTRIGFNFLFDQSTTAQQLDISIDTELRVESASPLQFNGLIELTVDEIKSDQGRSVEQFARSPNPFFSQNINNNPLLFFSTTDNFSMDFANFALSGTLVAGQDNNTQTVNVTFSIAADSRELTFGTLPLGSTRFESRFEVSEDGRKVSFIFDDSDSNITFELITYAEFITHFDLQDGVTGRIDLGDDIAFIGDTLSSVLVLSAGNNSRSIYISGGFYSILNLIDEVPEDLFQSLDIVEFYNRSILFENYSNVDGEGIYENVRGPISAAGGEVIGRLVCTGLCFNPFLDETVAASDQLLRAGDFIKTSASLALSTDVIGIDVADPTVTFKLDLSQQSLTAGVFDVSINFAGRAFRTDSTSLNLADGITVDGDSNTVRFANQDGIQLQLGTDENGVVTGSISKGLDELASISEENGALLVRFLDDESPNLVTLGF